MFRATDIELGFIYQEIKVEAERVGKFSECDDRTQSFKGCPQ